MNDPPVDGPDELLIVIPVNGPIIDSPVYDLPAVGWSSCPVGVLFSFPSRSSNFDPPVPADLYATRLKKIWMDDQRATAPHIKNVDLLCTKQCAVSCLFQTCELQIRS